MGMHTHVHIQHTQKDDLSLGTKFFFISFYRDQIQERILEAKRENPGRGQENRSGPPPPASASGHSDTGFQFCSFTDYVPEGPAGNILGSGFSHL